MYFATGSLLSGAALGVVARVGARRGRPRTVPRRFHQAAFIASSAMLAATALREWPRSRRSAAANATALLALCTLPQTSGWQRRHVEAALVAGSLHALGVVAHQIDAASPGAGLSNRSR